MRIFCLQDSSSFWSRENALEYLKNYSIEVVYSKSLEDWEAFPGNFSFFLAAANASGLNDFLKKLQEKEAKESNLQKRRTFVLLTSPALQLSKDRKALDEAILIDKFLEVPLDPEDFLTVACNLLDTRKEKLADLQAMEEPELGEEEVEPPPVPLDTKKLDADSPALENIKETVEEDILDLELNEPPKNKEEKQRPSSQLLDLEKELTAEERPDLEIDFTSTSADVLKDLTVGSGKKKKNSIMKLKEKSRRVLESEKNLRPPPLPIKVSIKEKTTKTLVPPPLPEEKKGKKASDGEESPLSILSEKKKSTQKPLFKEKSSPPPLPIESEEQKKTSVFSRILAQKKKKNLTLEPSFKKEKKEEPISLELSFKKEKKEDPSSLELSFKKEKKEDPSSLELSFKKEKKPSSLEPSFKKEKKPSSLAQEGKGKVSREKEVSWNESLLESISLDKPSEKSAVLESELSKAIVEKEEVSAEQEEASISFKSTDGKEHVPNGEKERYKRKVESLKEENNALREEMQLENDVLQDKIYYLEKKLKVAKRVYGELKEKVKLDIRTSQEKEEELETRLELLRKDSEAKVLEREKQVLYMKKKLGDLRLQLSNARERKIHAEEDASRYVERISRAIKALELAASMLKEKDSAELEVKEWEVPEETKSIQKTSAWKNKRAKTVQQKKAKLAQKKNLTREELSEEERRDAELTTKIFSIPDSAKEENASMEEKEDITMVRVISDMEEDRNASEEEQFLEEEDPPLKKIGGE